MAPLKSRYCEPCETYWPSGSNFVRCPICMKITTMHPDEDDFQDGSSIATYVTTRRTKINHANKITKFDTEVDKQDLERHIAQFEAITIEEFDLERATLQPLANPDPT